MTSKLSNLTATAREGSHNREIRRASSIPAVLYGYGINNINLQVDSRSFASIYNQAGLTSLITLTIKNGDDRQDHTVLIRDMQMHPLKNTVQHIDFYQPRLDQAITANVPLDFVGEAPAVKDLGGVLVRTLDEVELEALPVDLPHNIAVDITVLTDFEQAIHIRDLILPPKVELNHEPDEVVALVQPPRTEAEMDALEEDVKEDVAGVEGVEDKPEEDGEGADADTDKAAATDQETTAD
jgi:large subunit ribosomal protein L25